MICETVTINGKKATLGLNVPAKQLRHILKAIFLTRSDE